MAFMKKRSLIGMIALLSLSLLFSGCPGDSGDLLLEKTKSLAAELGPNAWASRGAITLTGDITLNKNFTLPEDISLSIPAGKTFTTSSGKTLTVERGGRITAAGNLILESGSNSTIDGIVTVKSGGHFTNNGSNPITGLIVVEAGGKYTSNTFSIGDNAALLSLIDGRLIFNSTSLILDGEAELTKNTLIDTINGIMMLKINSTLTIASSITLTIKNNTAAQSAVVGESGEIAPRIIAFGNFDFSDAGNTRINFYDKAGAALSGGKVGSGKIYKWDSNADNNGNPGWKGTS
jgi:hypothetical protein